MADWRQAAQAAGETLLLAAVFLVLFYLLPLLVVR
jgi:hypothetical protein